MCLGSVDSLVFAFLLTCLLVIAMSLSNRFIFVSEPFLAVSCSSANGDLHILVSSHAFVPQHRSIHFRMLVLYHPSFIMIELSIDFCFDVLRFARMLMRLNNSQYCENAVLSKAQPLKLSRRFVAHLGAVVSVAHLGAAVVAS